jgi:hypothetical protein
MNFRDLNLVTQINVIVIYLHSAVPDGLKTTVSVEAWY